MADFGRNKYANPRWKQNETANQLGYSSSTLQRYRKDIIMLSPYRIRPNFTNKRTKKTSNTNFDNNSHDHKRHRLTSNELKMTSNESVKNKGNKLRGDLSDSQNVGRNLIEQAFSSN